jgi:flagellar protein FlgJ
LKHIRIPYWLFVIFLFTLTTPPALGQANDEFMPLAVRLAQQSQRETTVPASVTLAQAVWETGRGARPIGEAKNYFGIKAIIQNDGSINVGPIASGWVWATTREWDGKKYIERRERFRRYYSIEDSFRDHGLLLSTNPRYATAMRYVDDAREFARQIAAAGYATSPTYGRDLIAVMDLENLYRYDLPRDEAVFLGQSEYLTVRPGQIFQIYFDLRNTGFGTWSPQDGYYLASANDSLFSAQPRQDLDRLVPPESIMRWSMSMVAPRAPGVYRTAWRMRHRDVSFGPELWIQVRVEGQPVEQSGPPLVWILLGGLATVVALSLSMFVWHTRLRTRPQPRRRLPIALHDETRG